MRKRIPRTYQLTERLIAGHAGSPVVCVDARAMGKTYRLHAERPGPEINTLLHSSDVEPRQLGEIAPDAGESPVVMRVDIRGALEQRAGYYEECGGWSDGHDAVTERLCAAFALGDALLVPDSPGGAHAGLEEGIRTALKAKEAYGRRCIGWIGEQCGSAATWWVVALCDEIYIPGAGAIGSMGARSTHQCIEGLLAKEGVAVTHFYAPGPGKIAFAEDAALSDEGKRRANRDVWDCYLSFEAAMVASPVGQRHGLTAEKIRALDADMLSGQRAVEAGLADDVASLDEVIAYSLALASGGDSMAEKFEKKTTETYENDGQPPPDAEEPEPTEEEEGDEEAEGETPEAAASDDDAPPSSKPPPKEQKAKGPARMASTASLAEILGASGNSAPALKAAAIAMRQVRDHAASVTGQTQNGAIIGGLTAMAEDAAGVGKLRDDLKAERRNASQRERMALLHKLAAAGLPGYSRGELLRDAITKINGADKRVVIPTAVYAEMKLSTLRGLVEGKLANGGTRKRRDPFVASEDEAKRAAQRTPENGAKTEPSAADTEAAKKHPTVIGIFNRPGNTLSLDQIAKGFAAQPFARGAQ